MSSHHSSHHSSRHLQVQPFQPPRRPPSSASRAHSSVTSARSRVPSLPQSSDRTARRSKHKGSSVHSGSTHSNPMPHPPSLPTPSLAPSDSISSNGYGSGTSRHSTSSRRSKSHQSSSSNGTVRGQHLRSGQFVETPTSLVPSSASTASSSRPWWKRLIPNTSKKNEVQLWHQQPLYPPSVCSQPAYFEPVYQQSVYPQPVSQQPVLQPIFEEHMHTNYRGAYGDELTIKHHRRMVGGTPYGSYGAHFAASAMF